MSYEAKRSYPSITRWLTKTEDDNLPPSDLLSNTLLVDEIHECIQSLDRTFFVKVTDKLFDAFRNEKNKAFVVQFLPVYMSVYFDTLHNTFIPENIRLCCETFLLGIYNLTDNDEIFSGRIPNIKLKSIYHESSEPYPGIGILTMLSPLKDVSMQKPNLKNFKMCKFSPCDSLSLSRRNTVFHLLLTLYNSYIAEASWKSRQHLCYFASKAASQGFSFAASGSEKLHRINFNSRVFIELLYALYFIMHNDASIGANKSLELIIKRARHDLLPDVIMVSQAMKRGDLYVSKTQAHDPGERIEKIPSKKVQRSFTMNRPLSTKASKAIAITEGEAEKVATAAEDVPISPPPQQKNEVGSSTLDELDAIEIENSPGLSITKHLTSDNGVSHMVTNPDAATTPGDDVVTAVVKSKANKIEEYHDKIHKGHIKFLHPNKRDSHSEKNTFL